MRTAVSILAALAAFGALAGPEGSLYDYAESVRHRVVGQIREALEGDGSRAEVSGVVTMVKRGRFYIQGGSCGLKVLTEGLLPSVGDRVSVSGAPTIEGGRVVFAGSSWRKTGAGRLPVPVLATAERLMRVGRASANARRVVVEGVAIGHTESGFALMVDDVPVNVLAETLPDFVSDCEELHPRVRVTGVADLMVDSSALLGESDDVVGLRIDVSAPGDILLVADAAYLSAKHRKLLWACALALLAVLTSGLAVFLVVLVRQRRGLFRTQTIMAERKRMADDIHDTIEQHLVGAGMLLKINRLKEAQDVLVRAKRELRDIVWGLKNDDMMRQTPAEMLRQLAHEENVKGVCRVDTRLDGLPEALDAAAMRDLSLIVREAIGNAVKHGAAKKIAISSDPLGDGWMLRVANDGAPFDPATAPGVQEGHFGLEGMRQRARRLGATVSVERHRGGMVLILSKNAQRI